MDPDHDRCQADLDLRVVPAGAAVVHAAAAGVRGLDPGVSGQDSADRVDQGSAGLIRSETYMSILRSGTVSIVIGGQAQGLVVQVVEHLGAAFGGNDVYLRRLIMHTW